MDLQELIDRAQITDALTRYTVAVDTGDFDLLDTVFTPDALIDYSESGGVVDAYPAVKAWLAEALPAFSRHRLHTVGQVGFDFAEGDDSADVLAYFDNPMRISDGRGGERVVEVGGIYRHTFVRTPAGWRSRRLYEQVVWTRGF
ncbi:nuclear transport factor 2 family protein [Nocardioides sp. zg-536]|uniref:Nuclear transport factor 2 family protein n=1 Tax=Nocardioides faecalis TaxID=2803858 RepID=A0A938Y5B3_9ACTN|nr:nuclear transport factor 2 family protein [Nocardioides faecalis]MBM9458528.1 nuclear transport factor 2 family protein [Nocardioides faecalis]QVI58532.1 nuclear transport factor 2 family protein [Nocardioides faecalis]